MPRPEHLNVPNTASGIARINREQELYDSDPEGWERREREYKENLAREEAERQEYHRSMENN